MTFTGLRNFSAPLLLAALALSSAPLKAEDAKKVSDRPLQIYLEPFEVPLAQSSRKINVTIFVEATGQDNQYRICQLRARIRDAINTELWTNPMGIVQVEAEQDSGKRKKAQPVKTRRDLNIEETERKLLGRVNRASGKRGTVETVYVLKGKVEPQGEDATFKHRRLHNPVTCGRINFREKGID